MTRTYIKKVQAALLAGDLDAAKAAYAALLPHFAKHPNVLFVCVTAPPLSGKISPEPLWKAIARLVLGKDRAALVRTQGTLAGEFNGWLKDRHGWLRDYQGRNVVVFDYYDILTEEGVSDHSRYATGNGYNSHPSRQGNEKAAAALPPLLNRAVRNAGLVK